MHAVGKPWVVRQADGSYAQPCAKIDVVWNAIESCERTNEGFLRDVFRYSGNCGPLHLAAGASQCANEKPEPHPKRH